MQINLINLKAALACASNEETRYYLCGVHVSRHADTLLCAATDGHALLVTRQDWDDGEKGGVLPASGIIIPASFIKSLKLSKSCDWAELTLSDDGQRVTIDYVGASYTHALVDGTFPDYRRVMPTKHTGIAAQYAPAIVNKFAAAAKLLGTEYISIAHNGDDAAYVTIGEADSPNAFGVIMPIRRNAGITAPPAWFAAPAEPASIAA